MPSSPVARLLAVAIVAAVAFFLLWPDARSHYWGFLALPVVPLLLAVFIWVTVQAAPPFDDRAFHRTLPASRGSVFLRVFGLPLAVAAGVAAVAAVYAWRDGLGWEVAGLSAAFLAVPLLGWCSACGVAFTLATPTDRWRSPGWIAVFGMPVFSAALLFGFRDSMKPADPSVYAWLTGLRTMALVAAAIFPPIWWLVAVRGRHRWGVGLAAWTGALLPWLYAHGDFFIQRDRPEVMARMFGEWQRQTAPVTFTRLAGGGEGPRVDASQVLRVDGLEPGETTGLWGMEIGSTRLYLEAMHGGEFQRRGALIGRAADGTVVWGIGGWVRALADTIRPGAPLAYLSPTEVPGEGVFIPGDTRGAWKIFGGDRTRWRRVASVPFGRSTRIRDAQLGLIRLVSTGAGTPDWDVRIDLARPDLEGGRLPMTEVVPSPGWMWPGPYAVVEREGNDRLLVMNFSPMGDKRSARLLARMATLSVEPAPGPERRVSLDEWKGGRLHLFWPEARSAVSEWAILPPP